MYCRKGFTTAKSRAGRSISSMSIRSTRPIQAGRNIKRCSIDRASTRARPRHRMLMESEVAQVLAQGWAQQRAGNIEQAAKLCEQALPADPENPDGHHLLGVIAHQLGHADGARHHLARPPS